MKTLTKSVAVEAALAGLFLAAVAAPALADHHEKKAEKAEKKGKGPAKKDATVHCLGVNSCKGTSECGVDGAHGCKGQNACKGKGWISLAKKDCMKQKGTVQGAKNEEAKTKAHAKTESAPAAH